MDLPIREHSAATSKVLLHVIIFMFFLLQILVGVVVKGFYDRFTTLEHQNSIYDQELDDLKTEIKIMEALMHSDKGS